MNGSFFQDPQADVLVSPVNESLVIDSHGSKIYGRLLLPAFTDLNSTCAVVIMLHGYPGIEQNLDIAQHLRMAGFAVVHFCYRGVWGGHGYYRFSHLLEDTLAVAEHIRENAKTWRIDPARLYLFGHSMGGFAAVNSMAAGLKVKGAIIMAPCDMAHKYLHDRPAFDKLMSSQDQGYFNTPSRDYIEDEVRERAEGWLFVNAAQRLDAGIPYRFIGGALDKATPPDAHILPVLEALTACGCDVQYKEFCDGHTFPASRVRLTEQIIAYLKEMEERA